MMNLLRMSYVLGQAESDNWIVVLASFICVRVEVGIIVLCTVGVLWRSFLKMQNEEKVLIGVLMCVYAKSWWWSQSVLLLVAKKAFSAVYLQRYV